MWRKWARANRRGRVGTEPMFKYECNAICLPSTTYPASVKRLSHNKAQLTGWIRMNEQPQEVLSEITRLSPHMTEEENPLQFHQFLNDFRSGHVRAVCDGSFFPSCQTGTAAWILESSNSIYSRWGRIRTFGEKSVQNAYRSELLGIAALMAEIAYISNKHSVVTTISIGCDNKGAVDKLNDLQIPVSPNTHHFDLLQYIQQIRKNSQIQFSFYWIKSHQDDHKDLQELPREEYLNVIVYSMAKSFNQECQEQDNLYQFDDLDRTTQCSIRWEDKHTNDQHIIRSLLGKTLQKLVNSERTKDYLCYKKKIEPRYFHQVDWDHL